MASIRLLHLPIRLLRIFALQVVILLACSGCTHSTLMYSINPDGSGKVSVHVVYQSADAQLDEIRSESSRKESQQQRVLAILENGKGIELWKDVSYGGSQDGRFEFRGTAYFKSLDALDLNLGAQGAGLYAENCRPTLVKEKDGSLSVVLDLHQEPKDVFKDTGDPYKGLSTDEVLAKLQAEYRELRPFLGLILDTFQCEFGVTAPGEVQSHPGLTQKDGTWQATMKGTEILKAMDELVADKAWLLGRFKARHDEWMSLKFQQAPDLAQKLFGVREAPKLILRGPFKPIFEYAAEVNAARAAYEKLLAELRPKPLQVNEAVVEGKKEDAQFTEIRPTGAMIKWAGNGIASDPSGLWTNDYILSITGHMPFSAVGNTSFKLAKALTDQGEDLSIDPDFVGRQLVDIKIRDEGKVLTFDVRLKRPSSKTRTIKELSGEVEVAVASGLREVDLGVLEFKKGTKSQVLGVEIKSVGRDEYEAGHQLLTLELAVPDFALEELNFYDEKGGKLDTSFSQGTFGVERFERTVSLKGVFPARGQIKVRVKKLKVYRLPFKLENFTLAGQMDK